MGILTRFLFGCLAVLASLRIICFPVAVGEASVDGVVGENASELLERAVSLVETGMEKGDDIDMFDEAHF